MKPKTWGAAGLLAFSVLATQAAGAQGTSSNLKDDLFAGTEKFAQGATGVNEISMDPDSLGLVNGNQAHRAHGLVLNVVRTYEYDKPGMYRIEDVEAFRKKLESGDWRCSVHTRDLKRGDSTDVCNRRRADGMVETAIITVEPKQLTFIHTVRKAGDGQSLDLPPVTQGAWDLGGPQEAHLAVQVAKLEAIWPLMQARLATLGPEMEARLAGMRARTEAEGIHLNPRAPRAPFAPGAPVSPRAPGAPASPLAPVQPE